MKLNLWLACIAALSGHFCTATARENARDILERSLQVQQSFRSLEGRYRSMFTNFAPGDDTPAADWSGRFVIARSVPDGAVDRLFCRDFDNLKGEPGDSMSQYINGVSNIRIKPDGTGEADKLSYITSASVVSCLNQMESRTKLMLDSLANVQLSDTVIDGNKCHLLELHTSDPEGEGWYRLAIDANSMMPIWYKRRDMCTGNFVMDQSSLTELYGLKVNLPVDSSVFEAPAFRTAQLAAMGSCRVGEIASSWKDLPDAVTGQLYSLDSLIQAGNVVVMDWSTSTCGACVMAMPTIDSLFRHYRNAGAKVTFVMMNPSDSRAQALGLIERKKIEYPVLRCPETVANSYGLAAFPVFLVVDRDGQIVFNQGGFGGNSDALYQQLKAAIDSSLQL